MIFNARALLLPGDGRPAAHGRSCGGEGSPAGASERSGRAGEHRALAGPRLVAGKTRTAQDSDTSRSRCIGRLVFKKILSGKTFHQLLVSLSASFRRFFKIKGESQNFLFF